MPWLKVSQLRATDIPMGSDDIMLQLAFETVNVSIGISKASHILELVCNVRVWTGLTRVSPKFCCEDGSERRGIDYLSFCYSLKNVSALWLCCKRTAHSLISRFSASIVIHNVVVYFSTSHQYGHRCRKPQALVYIAKKAVWCETF